MARVSAIGAIGAAVFSCKDTTGPITPETPAGVTVVLISPTSAKVTWNAVGDPASVRSFNVFRNGAKVGEANTPVFVDTGLAEMVTYRYAVSTNGTNGLVSPLSPDTQGSAVTPPDATPPKVVSTVPAASATLIDRNGKISATFSEPIDPATAVAANFVVRNSDSTTLTGVLSYASATKTIEFTPAASLPNSSVISVTISTGIKDVAGNPMSSPFLFSFTTRDDIPPTVLSTTIPASGDVPLTQVISATMSEPIDAATLTSSTVRLTQGAAASAVAGSTSYDSQSHVITFTPTAGLVGSTDYVFTLGPGIKDVAGNAMSAAFARSFRTIDATPPSVVSVSPVSGASSVPVNSSIKVVFSEALNTATINPSTFIVTAASLGTVSGAITYDQSTTSITFTPTSPLRNSTSYSVAVTAGITDVAGNALSPAFNSSFTTEAGSQPADVTPPTVVSAVPSPGSTGVSVSTAISVTFSEALNPSTITSSTFFPTGAGGAAVAGAVSYNSSTFTATFTPGSALQNGVTYTLVATTGIKDVAGNSLATQFNSTFTTVSVTPPPDTTPPTVVSSIPSPGSTGVSVSTTISVKFSEALNASTVTSSTFFLTGSGGATVAGSVSYNSTSFTVTFTPNSALQSGVTYTLVATTSIKDVAGNSLATQFNSTFTTASSTAPDTTPPTVLSSVPANLSTGISVTTAIRVTFSEAMDASSINGSTILLSVGSTPISGSVSYDATSRTASFTPSAGLLAENQSYTLTVTTGVKDVAGNALATKFVATFQTADISAPTITSRNPAPGSTGVPIYSMIRVGFSEPMNVSTINSSTVTLSASGSLVPGTVTYDPSTNSAVFTPTALLANSQLYTVTVTTGVKDLAGNALANTDSFTFGTAGVGPAFDVSVTGSTSSWSASTSGSVGIHFHIMFDQTGSTLSRSTLCSSGDQSSCANFALNEPGLLAIGPNTPGFGYVLVSSVTGSVSQDQVSFTMTNSNGYSFTFLGVVSSLKVMTGRISGATLPAEIISFAR